MAVSAFSTACRSLRSMSSLPHCATEPYSTASTSTDGRFAGSTAALTLPPNIFTRWGMPH